MGEFSYIAEPLRGLAVPIDSLVMDPSNARRHPEKNMEAIKASLARFGQRSPLVVQRSGMVVRAGNGRLAAAKALGWSHVACLVVDDSSIDAVAFAIADNRTGELAEWDTETLATMLQSLPDELRLDTGFGDEDLAGLLKGLTPEVSDVDAEPQVDRAEELRAKWGVQTGQVWELWRHRLACGSATKPQDVSALMGGGMAQMCFTSPPYASQRKYDEASGFKPIPPSQYVAWWQDVQAIAKDFLAPNGSLFVNIKEAADDGQKQDYVKRLVLKHIDEWGWKWIEEYCWPRPALPLNPNNSHRFKNGWESVFHFAMTTEYVFNPNDVRHESDGCFTYKDQKAAGKQICDGGQGVGGGAMSPVGQHTGLAYPSNVLPNFGGAKVVGHSAAFPVGLPEFFIRGFSNDGDFVYEPFSGSGTTIIACERLGRACRAIEISPGYVAVAIQRWVDATGGVPKCLT